MFFYFYSEHYIFLPFSTFILIDIIGLSYALIYFSRNSIPYSIKLIIICGLIVFITGLLAAKLYNTDGDLEGAKRGLLMIAYVFPSVLFASLLKKCYKNPILYSCIECLVWITIIQAIVSIVFFFYPSISQAYRSLIVVTDNIKDIMENLSVFRLVGIGDVKYATSAVQYGLMMWGIIALRHARYSVFGRNSIVFIIIITLFILTGIMSGRVFFVLLGVTPFYIYYLNKSLKATFIEIIHIFTPITIILIIAFVYVFSKKSDLIEWAFEIFINFSENGSLESESTNQLKNMYIFPDKYTTWFFGDGKLVGETGFFYKNVDVGYIRSIFYWGIIGSFIYYISQYFLYKIFKSISNKQILHTYVLFILIWLYIYSLKDFYSIERILVLFIVCQSIFNKI